MSRRSSPIIQDDSNTDPELEPLVPSDPACPERPAPFDFLSENVYYTETLTSRERKKAKRMVCECQFDPEQDDPEDACGENCLNRLLMIECGSRCPCGEYCTNKRFQRGAYSQVEVFKTDKKGWGLRTLTNIPQGAFVMEYCGEVITPVQFEERKKQYTIEKRRHYYFMSLRTDEILDATQKGNYSRFINHSCDPNCETQKWTVQGKLRIGFFTVRQITQGEEVTFDYQFQRFGDVAQRCYCGSYNCRGYLGQSKQATPLRTVNTRSLRDMGSPRESSWRRRHALRAVIREDSIFEKQIYDIVGSGWRLRNTDQVISISRIMLQAESLEQRVLLLHVLQATEDQVCLRKFLSLHGLRLLWSWMVDSPDPESLSVLQFREQVLQVLLHLPITTRNQLSDSQLVTMVTRWLKPTTKPQETVSGITDKPHPSSSSSAVTEQSQSQQQQQLQQKTALENSMETTVVTEADSNMDSEASKMEEEEGSCDSGGVVMPMSCDPVTESHDLNQLPTKTEEMVPDSDSNHNEAIDTHLSTCPGEVQRSIKAGDLTSVSPDIEERMSCDMKECDHMQQSEEMPMSCDSLGEMTDGAMVSHDIEKSHDVQTISHDNGTQPHDQEVALHDKEKSHDVSHDNGTQSHDQEVALHDKEKSHDVSHDNGSQSHDLEMPSHEKEKAHDVSHDKESESHDLEMTSHDKESEITTHDKEIKSHDLQMTSHEKESESHDIEMTSHDKESESHDLEVASHDLEVTSDNKKVEMESHGNQLESHDKDTESQVQSCDFTQLDSDTNIESHDGEVVSHDRSHDIKDMLPPVIEIDSKAISLNNDDKSHDKEIKSHDMEMELPQKKEVDSYGFQSHDTLMKSHIISPDHSPLPTDKELKSCDLEVAAPDEEMESHDISHDIQLTSQVDTMSGDDAVDDTQVVSHDLVPESHDTTMNSQSTAISSPDISADSETKSHDNQLIVQRMENETSRKSCEVVVLENSGKKNEEENPSHLQPSHREDDLNVESADVGKGTYGEVCTKVPVLVEKSHDTEAKSDDMSHDSGVIRNESHDDSMQSHDKSLDSGEQSHDNDAKSHDSEAETKSLMESHENEVKPIDIKHVSCENEAKSHDQSRENDTKSHDQSRENDTKSHDQSRETEAKSHDQSGENDTKSHDQSSETEAKSHDQPSVNKTKSHDQPGEDKVESHDQPGAKSHDQLCENEAKSHDQLCGDEVKSHDNETKSHDIDTNSHDNETMSHDNKTKSHDIDTKSHDNEPKSSVESCDVKSNVIDSTSVEDNEVISCEAEAKQVEIEIKEVEDDKELMAASNRVVTMATELLEKWEGLKEVFRIPKRTQSVKKRPILDSPNYVVSDDSGSNIGVGVGSVDVKEHEEWKEGSGRIKTLKSSSRRGGERKRRWDHWNNSPPPPDPPVSRQDTPPSRSGKRKVLLPKPKNIFSPVTPSHLTASIPAIPHTVGIATPTAPPYIITQGSSGTSFTSSTRFSTPPVPVQNTVIVQQGGQSVYVQQQVYQDGCQTTIMPTHYLPPTQPFIVPLQSASLQPPSFQTTTASQTLNQQAPPTITQVPLAQPLQSHHHIPILPTIPPHIPSTGFIRPVFTQALPLPQMVVPPPTSQSTTIPPSSLPPPPPTDTSLPHNWRSAKDPQGKTYYYHVVTRKSQWTRPTEGDADGSVTMELASSDEEDSMQTKCLRAPQTPDGTPPPFTMATDKNYDTESTDVTPSPCTSPHISTSQTLPGHTHSPSTHSPKRSSTLPSPHTPPLTIPPPSTLPSSTADQRHFSPTPSPTPCTTSTLPGPSTPPLSPNHSPTISPMSHTSPLSPHPPPEKRAKATKSKPNKTKEIFKHKVSKVVTQCLDQHRKPDCKYGRITCSEDFKYLARKLTHGIAEKEIQRRHGSTENLVFNDSTKSKVKEYIRQYMKKYGAVYTRV